MKTILTIITSILTTLAVLYIVVHLPMSLLVDENRLGTSLTTLTSSDLISNFPTIYNANNTALNNGKIEVGSTSIAAITTLANLSTVGTLTSGSLGSGFTTLTVPRGGTGTTTIAAFNVLLGSSTNAIDIVNGLGTSGQFLTSQGAGLPPQWSSASVDQSQSYTWTGSHTFTASTTFSGTGTTTLSAPVVIAASATKLLNLGGVLFKTLFPSSGTASSSVLMTDGGTPQKLTLNPLPISVLAVASPDASTNNTATTSLALVTLPANTIIPGDKSVEIRAIWEHEVTSGTCFFDIALGSGTATTSIAATSQGAADAYASWTDANIFATTTTSTTGCSSSINGVNGENTVFCKSQKTGAANQMYIDFRARHNTGASTACFLHFYSVKIIRP